MLIMGLCSVSMHVSCNWCTVTGNKYIMRIYDRRWRCHIRKYGQEKILVMQIIILKKKEKEKSKHFW